MTDVEVLAARCAELSIADLRKPGVYVLLDADDVVYIGESNNVLGRIGAHSKTFAFDRILYVAEQDKRQRRAIEAALARRFAPPNCDVYSRRDQERDAEILGWFGLTPDADNAQRMNDRASACWPIESRQKAARSSTYFRAYKGAIAAGKSKVAARRAAEKARDVFEQRLTGGAQ